VPRSPPPSLTLILACRSKARAQEAKDVLLKGHEAELERRLDAGLPVREGWRDGLRIEFEPIDMDAVGGSNGVLAFCERVKERWVSFRLEVLSASLTLTRYPHITTMYLNAGLGSYQGLSIPRFVWQMLTDGLVWAISNPKYQVEIAGAMSADRQRGMVWGINVLAPYIMVSSRSSLPSSRTADGSDKRAGTVNETLPRKSAVPATSHIHELAYRNI
jgi:3-keto steroid reductase